jgi:type 2 lantibiotic biosynthesis protein LanM
MALRREQVAIDWTSQPHVLCLGKTIQHAHDHIPTILAGFSDLYRFLAERREQLLATDSPLVAFRNLPTRFVFRPTRIYTRVLESSFEPALMQEGVDRHLHLEHLGRVHGRADLGAQHIWPLLRDEIDALTHTDIPIYRLSTSSCDLTIGTGAALTGCFVQSGETRVRGLFEALSETDLQRQLTDIRLALYTKRFCPPSVSAPRVSTGQLPSLPRPGETLTAPELLAEAERLAARLIQMVRDDEDGARWLALQVDNSSQRYYLDVVGDDLYQGNTGIALFLSALWHHTRRAEHRAVARAALAGIRQRLGKGHIAHLVNRGIGGALGLGSLIYGFTRISAWLADGSLLADAQALATLITAERIGQDRQFDVMAGAAGAILGLLTLYQAVPDATILERAVACGRHLVTHQIDSECGGRAWATLNNKMLTGFAHGAAGIVYALLKLYGATGDVVYLQAAQDGMDYERSLFVPEVGNWPDLRHDAGFMSGWCHGAPGVALARLAGGSILNNRVIERDIARGLATTVDAVNQATTGEPGHMCCGHLGRAEILYRGGALLDNRAWRQASLDLLSAVVHTARQEGGYTLLPGLPPDAAPPGLFQGLAGVGYTCLRFARSDVQTLPLVLLWE